MIKWNKIFKIAVYAILFLLILVTILMDLTASQTATTNFFSKTMIIANLILVGVTVLFQHMWEKSDIIADQLFIIGA